MDTNFQRAKSKENKTIRYQQIMDVADHLFHHSTYHDITLSVISKELNLARGGLYKYVSSKEEIFLSLYLQKEEAFVKDVCNTLSSNTQTIDSIAETFSQAFYKHIDLLKYHQILNSIIETNVSVEKLADFKVKNNIYVADLYSVINKTLDINEKEWFNIYLTILYHGVYLYDRVFYHDIYLDAMKLAQLEIDDINFIESFTHFIKIILKNL
ncbi:MAG: TetR family transcriptional regulator [Eubacteriales bacterium]|nr:TetR family transcriptional regulator [Eubacteriales bacterium]